MSRELKVALIEQFGGEEMFSDDYDNVADHGIEGISGCFYSSSIIDFYEKNKAQVKLALKEMAAEANLDSAVALVDAHSGLRDKHDTNLDDIAIAIHGNSMLDDNILYQSELIISWVIETCAVELCRNYQTYMSHDINDI